MVLNCVGEIPGLGMRFQNLCDSEAVCESTLDLVYLRVNSILQRQPLFCLMQVL